MLRTINSVLVEDAAYMYHRLKFRLGDGRRYRPAPVLVNGSPKTGTTWMLYMIASIPGYTIVGNFDRNIERYASVQPGDVVHGHDWYKDGLPALIAEKQIKVILMIRDPRDQLVSRMFHIKRSARHGWHERFLEMGDDEALMLCIEGRDDLPGMQAMINLTRTWLDGEAPMITIRYEALLAEPLRHFQRVIKYLGIEGEGLAEIIVQRNRFERQSVGWRIWQRQRQPGQEDASSHLRKGITGDWQNYLTEDHRQRIMELVGEDLIWLGYEQSLEW